MENRPFGSLYFFNSPLLVDGVVLLLVVVVLVFGFVFELLLRSFTGKRAG